MIEKNWRKQIWSIPNLLSIFRIVLIPVYMTIYITAESSSDYTLAAVILAVSCFTDLIDGKIARKFNMVTELGKLLDPIADKLTQLALIIALATRHMALRVFLPVFFVKELMQLWATVKSLKNGKTLKGALMSGKISTTVLFCSLTLMVLCPNLSAAVVNILTAVCLLFLLIAFADYAVAFFGKNKRIYEAE